VGRSLLARRKSEGLDSQVANAQAVIRYDLADKVSVTAGFARDRIGILHAERARDPRLICCSRVWA
jgi:hypothetical protein